MLYNIYDNFINKIRKIMRNLKLKINAKSHDPLMTLEVKGLPIGWKIDKKLIENNLLKRRPSQEYNTKRIEKDDYEIIGIKDNLIAKKTIRINVYNNNIKKKDYPEGMIRPGHADYVGYQFFKDYNNQGGGPFSGRITVLFVILGSIIENNVDFRIYGKVKQVQDLIDTIAIKDLTITELLNEPNELNVYDNKIYNQIKERIKMYQEQKDSLGALCEFRVNNLKKHIGGILFDSFEGALAQNLFSIGGIKGINFGCYQDNYLLSGKEINDQLFVENGIVKSKNNTNGGINGGITNCYEDIIFSCIIKPPSSIGIEQKTICKINEHYVNTKIKIEGRHDNFIANRVMTVIKAMTYITIYDLSC